VCGKAARTDLGGGSEVTRVPTAKACLLRCMSPEVIPFASFCVRASVRRQDRRMAEAQSTSYGQNCLRPKQCEIDNV
jgi:hypothetical protein